MARMIEKILLTAVVIIFVAINVVFISGQTGLSILNQEDNQKETQERITQAEAITIALDHAPGTVTEVESGMKNGRLVYEIEIIDGNTEIEVKVDTKTGNIVSTKREEREDEEEEELTQEEVQQLTTSPITEEKAIQIALAEVKGQVFQVSTEKEGGKILYEVEIFYNGNIVEVEIDASTGNIIEIEWEED
jgi:uncharacterized membrane protein YkoI